MNNDSATRWPKCSTKHCCKTRTVFRRYWARRILYGCCAVLQGNSFTLAGFYTDKTKYVDAIPPSVVGGALDNSKHRSHPYSDPAGPRGKIV